LGETMLQLLTKHILRQLDPVIDVDKEQYALKNNGVLRAKMAICQRKEGKELVSIDIKNAYNTLPRDAINKCLIANGIADSNRKLILRILNAAHSDFMDKVDTGTL
jgi:hypothetical protein